MLQEQRERYRPLEPQGLRELQVLDQPEQRED